MSGAARLELRLDGPGRRDGYLAVPWSRDDSAYGELRVPVTVAEGFESGPTALLTAGVHGDEFEGPVALMTLARELDPERLRGRVILVPAANPPALRAGRRTSPIDGGNLARLFPGDAAGGLTSRIAEGISRILLPHADLVLDLHSGGRSLEYLPCAWGRLPADPLLAERVIDALLAFGAPLAGVVRTSTPGTLVAAALDIGTVAIAAEIGGAGALTRETAAIARDGVARVLAYAGIMPEVARPLAQTRLLEVRPEHFLRSPAAGLFEPLFRLGETITEGSPAGYLHDPDRARCAPETLTWSAGGVVLCRRVSALIESGDTLAHVAEPSDRSRLRRPPACPSS